MDDAIETTVRLVKVETLAARTTTEVGSPAGVERIAELGEELQHHMPVLLAAARALARNEADARDLVQTTLEIAMRKAPDLRDAAALRPWLLTIQVHEASRLRRRLARVVHFEFGVLEREPAPGPNTDVLAVRTALSKLPVRARAAVALHYLADLPVSEVARAMGISENTAKGHLKAGLARLRKELGDD